MKRLSLFFGFLVLAGCALGFFALYTQPARADVMDQISSVPNGGLLYDNWFAAQGKEPPSGSMPIWSRQTTNTISGPDTWRCITCHGWDYQGKDGANKSGSNFTGFPGVMQASTDKSIEEIVAILKGSQDPAHDFSTYLDDTSLDNAARFIKGGLINDNDFIDPVTLKVIGGNEADGKKLFDTRCAKCHGADGTTLPMRFDGRDAALGTIAIADPWRFLHKTRYGTPGTPMPVGYDLGWTAQEGRDVLAYAQNMPSGLPASQKTPSFTERPPAPQSSANGPVTNLFNAYIVLMGAMAVSLSFALCMGVGLIGIIFLIVWLLRGSSK
jgi:mono/diheme cytochrome c family protein